VFHFEENPELLVNVLEQEYGIGRRGIPTTMGGEWNLVEGHTAWLSALHAVEREREEMGFYQ